MLGVMVGHIVQTYIHILNVTIGCSVAQYTVVYYVPILAYIIYRLMV